VHVADAAVARNAVVSLTVSNEDFQVPISIMEPWGMHRRTLIVPIIVRSRDSRIQPFSGRRVRRSSTLRQRWKSRRSTH